MELIRGFHSVRERHRGCVATIGAFDGVHLGHQSVLRQLIAKGKELGLPSTVIVFEPLPREFFSPHNAPARLSSFSERFRLLEELGIDRVMRISFDARFREMGAMEFIRRLFVDALAVKYIIVGDDLRFGRDRSGGFSMLVQAGKEYGFEVMDTATLTLGEERVSSTRIRQVLGEADFPAAERMLGRPYSISGRVIVGQQLGRTLGIPTANLELHRLKSPLNGVYAVEVEMPNGQRLNGVANVGTRPTVDNLPRAILEVHILDFSGDLYRRNISVIFRKRLRNEIRFDGLEALKAQIHRDIEDARHFFAGTTNK